MWPRRRAWRALALSIWALPQGRWVYIGAQTLCEGEDQVEREQREDARRVTSNLHQTLCRTGGPGVVRGQGWGWARGLDLEGHELSNMSR